MFFFDCDDTFDAQIVEKCVAKVKSDTDTVCYNYASVRRNGSVAEHKFSYLKRQYNKNGNSGTGTCRNAGIVGVADRSKEKRS